MDNLINYNVCLNVNCPYLRKYFLGGVESNVVMYHIDSYPMYETTYQYNDSMGLGSALLHKVVTTEEPENNTHEIFMCGKIECKNNIYIPKSCKYKLEHTVL